MDILRLKGLKFRGLHGFYDEERIHGNNFEVDFLIKKNLQIPANTDQLESTIDYQMVYNTVKSIMHGPSVKLIEHLAFLIGDKISELVDKDSYFEITVRKLNPPLPSELDYSEVTLIWPR